MEKNIYILFRFILFIAYSRIMMILCYKIHYLLHYVLFNL